MGTHRKPKKTRKPLVPPFEENHILFGLGYPLADAYANAGGYIEWLFKWPFRAAKELWRRRRSK